MLVLHDDVGKITQTVNDPVPTGHDTFLAGVGQQFVDVDADVSMSIEALFTKHYILEGDIVERPLFDLPEECCRSGW